jgi:hypothetical protein
MKVGMGIGATTGAWGGSIEEGAGAGVEGGDELNNVVECGSERRTAQSAAECNAAERLITAAARGDITEVLKVLRSGFPPDCRPEGEETALATAILNGHDNCAWVLLGAGADPNVVSTDNYWEAPMHAAAAQGKLTLLSAMVSVGGDINCLGGDSSNMSPMDCGAINGQVPVMAFLKQHGATDEWGDLLGYGLEPERSEVLDWLLANRWGPVVPAPVLRRALYHCSDDIVRRLLDEPIHDDGRVVHAAVARGDLGLLGQLIDRGCTVNGLDDNAMTPIEIGPGGFNLNRERTCPKFCVRGVGFTLRAL